MRARRHAPALLLGAAVLVHGVVLLVVVGRGWFGVDALHYLAQRGGIGPATEGLLDPYAGHLQPVLVVAYRLLYETFGLDTYLPYAVPAVLVHLTLCVVLFRLCVRAGASAWVALAASLVLLGFGTGSEAFLADAPVALTATALLAVTAASVLVARDADRRSLVTASALLLLASLVSAAFASGAVLVGALVLARRGWRAAAAVLAVPVLLFALWLVTLGADDARVSPEPAELLEVPERALTLLTAPLGSVLAVPGAGVVATALVVLAVLGGRATDVRLRGLALAGLLAAAAQSVLSGVASLQLGADAVEVGRYQYVVLVYLLPGLVVLGEESLSRVRPRVRELPTALVGALVLGLATLVLVNGAQDQREQWGRTLAEAEKARTWTTGGVLAVAAGQTMLNPDGAGFTVHGDDIETLGREGGATWDALKASPRDRVAAEAVLFTAVGDESYGVGGPVELVSASFDRPLRQRAGCQQVTAVEDRPQLTFTTFEAAQVAVTSQSTVVSVQLLRDGVDSEPQQWPLTPGSAAYVATSAELATVRLSFDAGGVYTICSA